MSETRRLGDRIKADRPFHKDGIDLYFMRSWEGERHVAEPFTLKEIKDGDMFSPFVTLEVRVAQELMDELWLVGLRPTEGSGSAGSLAATERHLGDMRALVAKLNDVKLP